MPKFTDQAQVQSSINTGTIKKGDVIMVANKPLIYNGIPDTNDPNAFMDSDDIIAIPMPKLLRMNKMVSMSIILQVINYEWCITKSLGTDRATRRR